MKCPKCEGILNKIKIKVTPEYGADILHDAEQVDEIELDQCYGCNGIWFDCHELDQYLSEKLLLLDSPKTGDYKDLNEKDGVCPRCEQKMVKKPAPKGAGVMVDVCEQCQGVWLDGSEIDKIEQKNLTWGEKHALVFRNFKKLFFNKEDE